MLNLFYPKTEMKKLPNDIFLLPFDYILCFRSFFILPKNLIEKTKIAAINFHPAPPEFPGSGCINFALYEKSKTYGVTTHLINEKVDNGQILKQKIFKISKKDNLDSLLNKTHLALYNLFIEFIENLSIHGKSFIEECKKNCKNVNWKGYAKKIYELEKLKTITLDIDEEETDRIVRATYTKNFPPRIYFNGYEFVLNSPEKKFHLIIALLIKKRLKKNIY